MAQKKTSQQRGMKRAEKVLARSQKQEKLRKNRVLGKLEKANCDHEGHDHKNHKH